MTGPGPEVVFSAGFAGDIFPELFRALGITLVATAGGMGLALVGGLILALARRSPSRALSGGAGVLVESIRSTPLLIQLYVAYFVFPMHGITLPALATGVLVLGLHYSAYTSEVYRSGIEGVGPGQWEAAGALGLGPWQIYRYVILPQALPPAVPALGNYLIAMFKDTPLLSAITVAEVLGRARIIGSETFRYLEPLTLVGLLFLALSLVAAAGVARLERWSAMRTGRIG